MPTYRVNLIRTESLAVEVEADDEESAIEAAFGEAPRSMCAQCSGWGQKWSIDESEWETLDEWRGADYDAERDGKTAEEV